MRTPTEDENETFSRANQDIENILSDNDPHTSIPDGPWAEVQMMLCLLWKAIGGEVKETWQEKREREHKERLARIAKGVR